MNRDKYFPNDASGLNADIERHRNKEAELVKLIADLEGKTDDMSIACVNAYRNILNNLRQSKAEVVSKLGK